MNVAGSFEPDGAQLDVDLAALCANYRFIREAGAAAAAAAVVKCDAYGLGAGPAARALILNEGCGAFFVAYAEEGALLRAAIADIAPDAAIYVFNGPARGSLAVFSDARLTPVVNSAEEASLWAGAFPGAPVALHVDTGMNRLGAPAGSLAEISATPGLNVALVMSHFACGSSPDHRMSAEQRARFEIARAMFPDAAASLAASAGALQAAGAGFDLSRIGVGLYGVSPFDTPDPRIKPVATLTAPILQVRDVAAGDSAGYGASHVFTRASRLAIAGLGYGDGYPRAGSNAGAAIIGRTRCPIVGRVSMDLIILDVTDAAEPVRRGDRAEFFGPQLSIDDAAAACGTIGYELLTSIGGIAAGRERAGGLGGRLRRRYLFDGAPAGARLTGREGA